MTDNSMGENTVDLQTYMSIVRRHRKLVIFATVVCVVLADVATFLTTPTYTSQSRVVVQTPDDATSPAQQAVVIETERGVASSLRVATIAAELMETDADAASLLPNLTVQTVTDAQILKFTYQSPDAQQAFNGADAFARAYLRFRTQQASEEISAERATLERQDEELTQGITRLNGELSALADNSPSRGTLESDLRVAQQEQTAIRRAISELDADTADAGTIIDEAEVPSAPSSPDLKLNLAAGLLMGLIGGVGAAFLLERFRRMRAGTPAAAEAEPTVTVPYTGPDRRAPAPQPSAPVVNPAPIENPAPVENPAPIENPAPVPRPPAPEPRPAVDTPPDVPAPQRAGDAPMFARAAPPARPRPSNGGRGNGGGGLPVREQPARSTQPEPPPEARKVDPAQQLAGLGIRLLGTVPRGGSAGRPPLPEVAPAGTAVSSAFDRLHISVEALLGHGRLVVVAAAEDGGLAAGAAANLAASAARHDRSVLLLDADLAAPLVHDRLDLINHQGMAELLRGERPAEQVMQGWSGLPSLCVVTAGDPRGETHLLLAPGHLASRLASLRSSFDLVVVSAPPVVATTEGPDVCAIADGVLLVMDAGDPRSTDLAPAATAVRQTGADVLGAVLVEPAGWESITGLAERVAGTPTVR